MRIAILVLAFIAVIYGGLAIYDYNVAIECWKTQSSPGTDENRWSSIGTVARGTVARLDGSSLKSICGLQAFYPVVAFTAANKEAVEATVCTFPNPHRIGDSIEVSYSKDNPKDCKPSGIEALFLQATNHGLVACASVLAIVWLLVSFFMEKLKQ